MQKVLERRRFGPISQAFADEIFDSFNVMIRFCLDGLDAFCIVQRKVVNDVIQDVFHHAGERRQFGYRGLIGKALQPANFDENAEADQAVFAKYVA